MKGLIEYLDETPRDLPLRALAGIGACSLAALAAAAAAALDSRTSLIPSG